MHIPTSGKNGDAFRSYLAHSGLTGSGNKAVKILDEDSESPTIPWMAPKDSTVFFFNAAASFKARYGSQRKFYVRMNGLPASVVSFQASNRSPELSLWSAAVP